MVPVIRELAAQASPAASTPPAPRSRPPPWPPAPRVVNDVSGGLADPGMAAVVADAGVPWILMHWRGHSVVMAELAVYDDVVAEVRDELLRQGGRGRGRRRARNPP